MAKKRGRKRVETGDIERRSLTRMVLPFSFWNEEAESHRVGGRPGVAHGYERSVRALGAERSSWCALGGGQFTNLGSVLLEQVVGEMFRPREGQAEVSLFRMKDEVRTGRFGHALSVVAPRVHKGLGAGVAPASEVFACTLSDVSLVLCSTGVGLLAVDLHLWDEAEALPGPQRVTSRFESRLTEFVNLCEYYGGQARSDLACVFLPGSPLSLAPAGPVRWVLGSACLDRMFGRLKAEADLVFRDVDLGPETEKLVGRCKRRLHERAFNPIKQTLTGPGGTRIPWSEVAAWLAGGSGGSTVEQALTRRLERLRSGLPDDLFCGLDSSQQQALRQCWDRVVARMGDVLSTAHAQGSKVWPSWCWEDLVAFALGDLGLRVPPGETPPFFLNGDRFFAFSHVWYPGVREIDPAVQGDFALHLALRQGPKYLPNPASDTFATASRRFLETHLYVTALEGMAVLQAEGLNPEHARDSTSVRFRQFLLVTLGLLYRFTLLDIAFAVIGRRDDDPREELEAIQQVDDRVSHFTHRIYNSHVSNFSHLQALYESVHDRFKIDRLWSDVDRDVSQYLERRKRLEAERHEAARSRFRVVVTWFVVLIGTKDLLELFTKLCKITGGWFPECPRWTGFGLYLGLSALLVFGVERLLFRPRR